MLTGTIKSYSDDKKYGFIQSENGESYFFHFNDLEDDSFKPKVGLFVSFDDIPTPKGMAAKKIKNDDSFKKIYTSADKDKFFMKKSDSFGDDFEIVYKGKIFYSESKDPNEALDSMINQAKIYGFNSLINVKRTRRTGSKMSSSGNFGSYKFTIHGYTAIPALVKKIGYSNNQEKIKDSDDALNKEISLLKQKNLDDIGLGSSWGSFIVYGIIIIIIFFIIKIFQ